MALSSTLKAELLKDESVNVVALDAVEISDPSGLYMPTPLRYVNNTEDLTINGNLYKARFFDIPRPPEGVEGGDVSGWIEDADLEVFVNLEKMPPVKEQHATVKLYTVLDTTPNVIELSETFELLEYNVADDGTGKVQLSLSADLYLEEEIPAHSIEPSTHPAAFRSNQ